MHSVRRFSVVCPAYNAGATVVRAIESCLVQTYPPHEVIVVDDGSTDGTPRLLEDAFGDKIRLIRLAKNSGPSAARNVGLDAATGDFIALQDADDWWHPEKLERVTQAITATQANFLFHRYTQRDEKIQLGSSAAVRWPLWKLLLRNTIATPCAVFWNDRTIRFDERFRHMEDWDFFLHIAEKHGALYLNEPLTQLGRPVLTAGGLSSSRWRMRLGEMRVMMKWAGENPEYVPLLPALLSWSLMKAAVHAVRGR